MANTIIMSKYQGLGNDYLILDRRKIRYSFRERRLHFSAREDLGLVLTVCSMDR